MKMLVDRAPGGSVLPVDLEALKLFLRINGEDAEDATLTNMSRSAAAEIEQFAQIALLNQTIRLTIVDPERECLLALPIGPVAVAAVPSVTIDGDAFTGFDFIGGTRPLIRWQDCYFGLTPTLIQVEYQAGFGATHEDIPADLTQALFDQAGLHFDCRAEADPKNRTLSPHTARIAARYRGVTL
ncbi:MAG: phage head-tail connector protein [Antarcticimicrobium sp.]|uniref:head-tail connector protein n=1 Tax=Antarcticimicrobium sp. TaxID=2824147 RepID=UPI00262682C4|nr:phage head-tail connector protein [Antarcticimicrobium sp.]MDF1716192.1 phage head-tail connector protein [Antarcticimicrobium sp.]